MKKKLCATLFAIVLGSFLILGYGLASSGVVSKSSEFESTNAGCGQMLSGNWLSGWVYRKAHNITGSNAGVQANYPMMINVRYDNGMDFEGEVHLDGKCRTDFGDIRFTDSTGNNLDYWIQQKVDGVQALFWVEIHYIPDSPDYATIYVYYGNPNASTTSNKDWTFDLATDFEDGTTQGWSISWSTYVTTDGVYPLAFQGDYCRFGNRKYGSGNAGNGDFYERFQNTVFLTSGSYRFEGATMIHIQNSYLNPKGIKLLVNGVVVDSVTYPGIQWHWLAGNFTVDVSSYIGLDVEFHLYVQNLHTGGQGYSIDSMFVRKWCDPEPTHGNWGVEETSDDNTAPRIVLVEWIPTAPYPFVLAAQPRQGEPVIVRANVSEEGGSGIDFVKISYRANISGWWNASMTFNATIGLWASIIPGQPGNATVEFFIEARDNAGNCGNSSLISYEVKSLILGDLNGDRKVDIKDIAMAAKNYGKMNP